MPKESFKAFIKRVHHIDYGKGEIKTFSPQIKEAIILASKGDLRASGFQKKMRSLGFKIVKSSGIAFIGDKQVIKLGYLCETTPSKNIRVPTVFLSNNSFLRLMIQPKATIPKSFADKKKIADVIRKRTKKFYDIHAWNVGLYKNKEVLFDW